MEELWRGILGVELRALQQLEHLLGEADARLNTIGAMEEQVVRVRTTPGVGPRLAETIVAFINAPHRFKNRRRVDSRTLRSHRPVQRSAWSAVLHRLPSSVRTAALLEAGSTPDTLDPRTSAATWPARARSSADDVPGSEVSRGRFFEDRVVQCQIRRDLLEPAVLPIQLLQPLGLI